MSYKSFVDDHENLMNTKLIFQRWFYALVGLLTVLPIILLTLGQIQNMRGENNEFAFCLLLIVHSGLFIFNEIYSTIIFLGFVIFSMISTALFCRKFDLK